MFLGTAHVHDLIYEAMGKDCVADSAQIRSLIEGNMSDLELGETFDAVLCLFSSIGYLENTGELDAAVSSMARHLNVGGILLVDGLGLAGRLDGRRPHDSRCGDGRSRDQGRPGGVGAHRLTLFEPQAYEAAFSTADLEVEVLESPMPSRDRVIGQELTELDT
jgi:SAM-dependent methyltransferase